MAERDKKKFAEIIRPLKSHKHKKIKDVTAITLLLGFILPQKNRSFLWKHSTFTFTLQSILEKLIVAFQIQ